MAARALAGHADAVLEFPQSGERFAGVENMREWRSPVARRQVRQPPDRPHARDFAPRQAGIKAPMARSIWNGTVTFGMVNVPVKLYSATESKTVRFHEVHQRDGARIEHRKICPKHEREVPSDQIVKGYEVSEDKYVVLDKDEIKAAAGDRGKVIHIEDFVDARGDRPGLLREDLLRRVTR